ncbi:MAG: hypothetical protein ACETWM_15700 [Candidatus Lokiarchaeia archaeon]
MQEYIRWLLPLLRFPQIIILLSIMLLLCLVLGRFTLKVFRIDKYLSPHFAVNVSIYGAAGLIFTIFVLNVIGILFIGTASLIIFSIIIASAVFILWRFGDLSLLLHKAKNLNWSLSALSSNIVPLILIVLTLYHFSRAIEIMGWPAVGDTLWAHGPYTSLLLYSGKITLTLEPLSSLPVWYPMGYHTVAAHFASWFDIFPGEAVFLLGGLIIILIPLITYSLTYLFTKSIPLSLLTYFATFIIHPEYGHWGRWLMARFYVGAYPNLAALLIVIFSTVILGLEYAQPENVKKRELYVGSIVTLFLSLLVLILIYPNFAVFVAIMIIFILAKHHREIVPFIQKKPSLIIPPLAFGLLFMLIPNSSLYIYSPESYTTYIINTLTGQYELPTAFFYNHITGYIMCIALPISILFLFKKKYFLLSLYYITVFCIIIAATSPAAPTILQMILPDRAVMIPWIISWPILSIGISELFKIRIIKKHFKPFINLAFVFILVCFIVTPQFTSSLALEFSGTNAQRWSWYVQWESFPYDYAAILWINYNIPPEDLILIDRSHASSWIISFSVKNITFTGPWIMDSNNWKRLLELEAIWNNPYENDTVYQLLEKYNVSYIFITSEYGYFLPKELPGGFLSYAVKPFTPSEYISIFDTYPFLKIAFRFGFTTVYKVDIASEN